MGQQGGGGWRGSGDRGAICLPTLPRDRCGGLLPLLAVSLEGVQQVPAPSGRESGCCPCSLDGQSLASGLLLWCCDWSWGGGPRISRRAGQWPPGHPATGHWGGLGLPGAAFTRRGGDPAPASWLFSGSLSLGQRNLRGRQQLLLGGSGERSHPCLSREPLLSLSVSGWIQPLRSAQACLWPCGVLRPCGMGEPAEGK